MHKVQKNKENTPSCAANDHYTNADFYKEFRTLGDKGIDMIHGKQPIGDFSDPVRDHFMLVDIIKLEGSYERDFGTGLKYQPFGTGFLDICPPDYKNTILVHESHEYRVYNIPVNILVESNFDSDHSICSDLGAIHDVSFKNFHLKQICSELWEEANADNPHGLLFTDELSLKLGAQLLRSFKQRNGKNYKLATSEINKIHDFILSSLADDFSIDDLSSLVGQSKFQFIRNFKTSIGLTPYQYVLERRIKRARDLISINKISLAEIAYQCGFSSQSHMTEMFTKRIGLSPASYRDYKV